MAAGTLIADIPYLGVGQRVPDINPRGDLSQQRVQGIAIGGALVIYRRRAAKGTLMAALSPSRRR